MFRKWEQQRNCFHHDHKTGTSWIRSMLIDNGSRKHFWCTKCERDWFV